MYQRLIDALEAMEKKELGTRSMFRERSECFCAVGALLQHEGFEPNCVTTTGEAAGFLKMPLSFVVEVTLVNDNCNRPRPERHAFMIDWAQTRLDEWAE